jgi:hypothetical protein
MRGASGRPGEGWCPWGPSRETAERRARCVGRRDHGPRRIVQPFRPGTPFRADPAAGMVPITPPGGLINLLWCLRQPRPIGCRGDNWRRSGRHGVVHVAGVPVDPRGRARVARPARRRSLCGRRQRDRLRRQRREAFPEHERRVPLDDRDRIARARPGKASCNHGVNADASVIVVGDAVTTIWDGAEPGVSLFASAASFSALCREPFVTTISDDGLAYNEPTAQTTRARSQKRRPTKRINRGRIAWS